MISCFRRDINKIFAFFGIVLSVYSEFVTDVTGQIIGLIFEDQAVQFFDCLHCLTLEDGTYIGCPETSVKTTNLHCVKSQNIEDR